jgi:SAM-dependent methyltransferase
MKQDRERWSHRYESEPSSVSSADELLLTHADLLRGGGRALDLACGRAGNSLFLAERGYRVDAVDVSFKAVSDLMRAAAQRGLAVRGLVADLDDYLLPTAAYDVATVFYFFDEKLMPAIAASLKPSGLIFYATFNQNHRSLRPDFNPAYLVPEQGLASYFPNFEIFFEDRNAGTDRNVCQLIARRPRS